MGIVTKSPLVVRDIDVLVELGRAVSGAFRRLGADSAAEGLAGGLIDADAPGNADIAPRTRSAPGCQLAARCRGAACGRVSVWFSIALADNAVAAKLEPGAPPPSARFRALRKLADAGVSVGVMVAPIIPGLTDREIPAVLARAADAGARSVCHSPVRLPGHVADVFLTRLRREFPAAADRVEQRICDSHGGRLNDPRLAHRMRGEGAYWESVERLFDTMSLRYGLQEGHDRSRETRADDPSGKATDAPLRSAVTRPADTPGAQLLLFDDRSDVNPPLPSHDADAASGHGAAGRPG